MHWCKVKSIVARAVRCPAGGLVTAMVNSDHLDIGNVVLLEELKFCYLEDMLDAVEGCD